MDEIGAIIGIVTGLISIFTFLTGVSSLQLLKAETSTADGGQPVSISQRPRVYVRSRLMVWLMFAAFFASLAVTLSMGLSGGDVEGAVFILLLIGGAAVIGYVLRFRQTIAPLPFGIASTLILTAAGFGMGSISRGEEAVDAVAGLVIGLCITVIAWLFRSGDGTVDRAAPGAASSAAESATTGEAAIIDTDLETEILRLAADNAGEVTISGVALHTRLSLDEARTLLDSLDERGHCKRTEADQGATVYRFPDLV